MQYSTKKILKNSRFGSFHFKTVSSYLRTPYIFFYLHKYIFFYLHKFLYFKKYHNISNNIIQKSFFKFVIIFQIKIFFRYILVSRLQI